MSNTKSIQSISLISLSTIVLLAFSVVIMSQPVIVSGMECLFLLPLSCAICTFVFQSAILKTYRKFPFLCLYLVLFVRYVVAPLFMSMNNICQFMNCNKESYFFAIIVMMVELFSIFIAINHFYRNTNYKDDEKTEVELNFERERYYAPLSIIGIIFIVALIVLVWMRGHLQNVFDHLSILNTQNYSDDELFNYDFDVVIAIKTLIALQIIFLGYRISRRSNGKFLFVLLSVGGALLNIFIYDSTARSNLLCTAFATVLLLSRLFPQYKKPIILSVIGGVIILIFGLVLNSNFWWAQGDAHNIISGYGLKRLALTFESYTNNVSTIAWGFSNYQNARQIIGLDNYFAEFFGNFGFFAWPGLRTIREVFTGGALHITNIFREMINYHAIIPSSIHGVWMFGPVFGTIFDVLFYWYLIKSIKYVNDKRNSQNNIYYYYWLLLIEWTLALGPIYNLWILLYSITGGKLIMIIVFAVCGLERKIVIKSNRK